MHPRSNLSKTLHPSFRMQQEAAPLFGERFVIINIANSSLWTCAKILRVTSQSWRLFRPRAINLHTYRVSNAKVFKSKWLWYIFWLYQHGVKCNFSVLQPAICFREISNRTLCNTTSEVHHKDITFKTTSKAANKRPTDEVDDDLWQRMLRVNSTRKSDLKVNFCTPLSWTKEGKTWMYTWKKWPSAFF